MQALLELVKNNLEFREITIPIAGFPSIQGFITDVYYFGNGEFQLTFADGRFYNLNMETEYKINV